MILKKHRANNLDSVNAFLWQLLRYAGKNLINN